MERNKPSIYALNFAFKMNQHDFAQMWHALTDADPNHRGEQSADLTFWREHAAAYDANTATPDRFAATLKAIQQHLRPTDTLLDVGAGTGRFALPLAKSVRQLTALDHADPMLDILRQKSARQQVDNIIVQQAAWEAANVPKHDVVLAAWSLYRLPDIIAGMRKLIAATRRTLIIVTSPGHAPDGTPMHIYFYGALWQAGVFPEIKIVWEQPAGENQASPVALIIWHNRG